jgi:hypothetical protein
MGCSASTATPAAVPAAVDGKKDEQAKAAEPTAAAEAPAPAVPTAEVEAQHKPPTKERRASAKTRVRDMCDEGWLEIAEAYCACMANGVEWGNDEATAASRVLRGRMAGMQCGT